MADPSNLVAAEGLSDVLGSTFQEVDIYDYLGLHVAFAAERRGDDHIFRATVQNNWTAPRRVTFIVTPERQSGARPKIKLAKLEGDFAPGEVGCLELVMPIPPEAYGRYRFHYSLRSHGPGGKRCRKIRRKPLPHRVTTSDRLFLALGVGLLLAAFLANKNSDGVYTEIQIEARDRPRSGLAPHGALRSIWRQDGVLPAVHLEDPASATARHAAIGIGILALGMLIAIAMNSYPGVYVVNAFDERLSVTIGNIRTTVEPKSYAKVELPMGQWRGIARNPEGRQIDAATITARLPMGYVVWNVAGAAPVYVEGVEYGSSSDGEPDIRFFCGKNVLEFRVMQIQDAFKPPPDRADRGSTRHHLDVLDMNDPEHRCP